MTLHEFQAEWLSESPVIVAHTSGSTGTPKEILLRKADMVQSARATCRFFGLDRSSRLHCPLAFDYIAAKMMAVRAEVSGAVLSVEPPSAMPLSGYEGDGPIDLLPVVPYQIDGLLASPASRLVRNLIVGGAPMSPAQEAALRSSGMQAFATYGMTETSSHVALRDISAGDGRFTALPGFTFERDGRGCLVIANQSMSWRRMVTNDVVDLASPTRFRWLTRYDNIINSGGVKVMPEEVERVAARFLPPDSFYVTSRPDMRLGREIVLVVDEAVEVTDGELLLTRLRGLLPRYHAPKALVRAAVSRTSSGKILRRPLEGPTD